MKVEKRRTKNNKYNIIIWDDAILIISIDSYHYTFAFYQLAGWPQLFRKLSSHNES